MMLYQPTLFSLPVTEIVDYNIQFSCDAFSLCLNPFIWVYWIVQGSASISLFTVAQIS